MTHNMRTAAKVRCNHVFLFAMILLLNEPNKIHGQAFLQYINNTMSQVCPYTTFCSQGPAFEPGLQDMTPCCTPCSCQPDCISRGNCCPDFVSPNTEYIAPSVKCWPPVHTNDFNWLHQIPVLHYYYITDTCPPGYDDQDIIEKCMNPQASLIQDVIDVATVSDDEMIYSNRHCARCNNVTTFSMWKPILYNFKFNEKSSQQSRLPSQYVLYFVPADVDQTRRSRCFMSSTIIDHCNVTGQQDFYDTNLVKACEESTMFYKVEGSGRERMYKNPFCFLCNMRQGTTLNHQCIAWDPLKYMIGKTGPNSGFALSLAWILARNVPHAMNTDNEVNECGQDEFYDQHFNICRGLHCPVFSVPVEGQCVSTQLGLQGFTVSTVFDLSTNEGVQWESVGRDTMAMILNKLLNTIGLKKHGCRECMNALFTREDGNHSDTFLLVNHQTTARCTLQTLTDTFWKLSPNPVNITIKIRNMRYILTARLNYEFSQAEFARVISDNFHAFIHAEKGHCPLHYVLNDRCCAYIEINEEEFNSLLYSGKLVRRFRCIFPKDEGAPVYRICIDDYEDEPSKSNANNLIIRTAVWIFFYSGSMVFVH